jgi:hypothetical protein
LPSALRSVIYNHNENGRGGQMVQLSAILEMVRNFGLAVAAFVGIFLAWKRVTAATRQADATLRQAELARRNHVAELFNQAVGQLTDAKLEVRLGAIYTLRQIARDFPDLAEPTVELLSLICARARENTRAKSRRLMCVKSLRP